MSRTATLLVGLITGAVIAASVTYVVVSDDTDQTSRPDTPSTSPISPTPSPSIAIDPTPAGSPSPDAEAAVGLEETHPLRLDGIGGIVVGMKVVEAEAVIGRDIRVSSDFSPACRYASIVGGPKDLALMISHGRIVRVDVFYRSRIETVSGIEIGDPADEVFRTYGDRIEEQPHPYLGDRGSYLVYHPEQDTDLLLIFETDRDKVTSFRSGYEEQVRYIEGCA